MTALQDYRVKASILLKQLKQAEASAAARFRVLPYYNSLSEHELLAQKVQRKHALLVVALEAGFGSWEELKASLTPPLDELLMPRGSSGFLNEWHSDYEMAKAAREAGGGYLFPYKSQFFIVQRGYIELLGLNPDDTDWALMGYDAVKPADAAAWGRMRGRLERRA